MERFEIVPKTKIDQLPKTAGVYAFFSKNLEAIYIGKAINIQSRVKNHFNQPSYRDNLFIEKVDKIGFFETGSEIEALILEANLIKKYQPKFNVVWRDDKNYFYVAIAKNKEKIPYVFITHQKNQEKTEYIGPFVEGTALKKTLRFLRRAFPYYTSAKHPKNKCTYCHLDLCPGPEPDLADYRRNIKKLILILKGKRSAVLRALKKEMKQASAEQNFEKAGKIRDKIYNLQQIMAHTHVIENSKSEARNSKPDATKTLADILEIKKIDRIECYDVSNIQGKHATGSMIVFVNGEPNKNLYRKFKINPPAGGGEQKPNDIAMLKETLERRFLHQEWEYPEIMLIDGGRAQLNVAVNSKNQNLKTNRIKVISIAKGRQELFIEGQPNPIFLKNLPQDAYSLIKSLDDEAHRFAITYHKKLRSKGLFNK